MLNIGCHLSAAKGYMNMGKEAKSIDANTFQFFTRNPRGGKAKAIDEQDVKNFLEFMKENNFSQILAHAPYTLNACSNKEETREFALNTMADDLRRMEYTPNQLYNFHPGSHVGQGVEIGIDFIVKQLNTVLTPDMTTTVLLETMAGKGTEIGRSFEELKEIRPDALIISDPGVFMIAREVCPEIDIHISTQANNTNYGTYQFWHQLGARRVVTARELSMAELKEIREKAPAL